MNNIEIRGARTHNLKNIDVTIPKQKFVVFTGVSGSGKSSLVFDTIYTEAQRQLIETFSTFARRRLPQLSRPPVDEIRHISPCIVIDQKRMGASSRSTVGTATEIYTYMRMLFSRCARPFIGWSHRFSFNHPEGMCPACKGLGKRITVDIDKLLDPTKSIRDGAIKHPDYDIGKWYYREILWSGVVPFDTPLNDFSQDEMERLLWADKHPISYEDRGKTYSRTFDGVARKLEQLHVDKDEDQISGVRRAAYERLFHAMICPDCKGSRLNKEARTVELAGGWAVGQLVDMELIDLDVVLASLPDHPSYQHMRQVVDTLVCKMRSSLSHLIEIGVGYLSLNRAVPTLSGGESQRVKMARQLDCDLVDLIYILDEPSVGLHPRDIDHLIVMLNRLRDAGNSVLVVEHDPEVIAAADWIIDIGPKAGKNGGQILFNGPLTEIVHADTPTARVLTNKGVKKPPERRAWHDTFPIRGANSNNLKNVDVDFPKNVMTCITGVAGSGKSSLIHEFIDKTRKNGHKITVVDQRPVGRSSRSNPATYIGIFDQIRRLFAKANKVSLSLFSFNSKGSCPECKGKGYIEFELSFIDDIKLTCSRCEGRRYRDDVLRHTYRDKSIHDVLEMTVDDARAFFSTQSARPTTQETRILKGLTLLQDVGVGYLRVGQSLSTLSGGEAQRIKLASELTQQGNIYVLDEPTTGLHPTDISKLLTILNRLVDAGNTVIVIEHNLDVAGASDWIIDIGPEGGKLGGQVVAQGTPEQVATMTQASLTAGYLKEWLHTS